MKKIERVVSADAETVCEPEGPVVEVETEEESEENSDDSAEVEKKKVGFRERKIIEYENRIRHFSTPWVEQ